MGRVRDLLSSLGKLAILATVQARRGSASVRVPRPHWSRQGTAARKHSRYRLDLGRRARDGHVLGKAISKGRKETRSTPNKQCISWPSSISRSNPLPRDFCDLTPISLQGILLETGLLETAPSASQSRCRGILRLRAGKASLSAAFRSRNLEPATVPAGVFRAKPARGLYLRIGGSVCGMRRRSGDPEQLLLCSLARARAAACGRLQLFCALRHRGSFLVRKSLGLLSARSRAPRGFLRAIPVGFHRDFLPMRDLPGTYWRL